MVNLLSVDSISKSYGDKVLFENLSFGLQQGDKCALVAANGTGKTTLLRLLTGKDSPDTGFIANADGLRAGFLEQQPDFDPALTIAELINSGHTEVMQAIKNYEAAVNLQTEASAENAKTFELANSEMERLQAWNYDQRLKQLLTLFEITDLSQVIGTLSGGQRKRLALALVLLDEPELLFLDEPTNHLDIGMIEWLERYLSQANTTLLMVTHDRYFLDRVCNNILELFQGELYHHKGNYEYYLRKSEEREENLRIATEKAGQLLKHEQEWMRRQPKARTTKSKSRIDAFYELKEKAGQKRNQQQMQLEVSMQRIGGKVLEMKNVSKAYGENIILDEFEYLFTKGERIGIIGKNGIGKTSFLNLITGKEKADSGQVISGETVVYGYYTQEGFRFSDEKKVIDVVKDIAEIMPMGDGRSLTASQLLSWFMFPPKVQQQQVSLLSGGEQRRLYLLTVLVRNPNFLILDEPTNDLDLLTLQTLEAFLQNYKGCLIVVSHDRYFMDQVVDQLFVFEGDGKVRGFVGNYSDYKERQDELQRLEKEAAAKLAPRKKTKSETVSSVQKKRSYKEQKEFEQLAADLQSLEKEKHQLTEKLSVLSDYQDIEQAATRIKAIDAVLDEKEMRWLELDELG
ncbi:MAG: ABC-F family ATP-binding cassette domain-containing protein [Bacteroidales bacterium]|jgi:ATP-binding cassette subfamily F protein uup|nr:ABC-F family ATP-binding cassette domain-containing protein [Bacteroidales bacterium]